MNADDILVLKNIGPKGAQGMPQAGYIPMPLKLARAGVKDMLCISDGRICGTAAETVVVHVTPDELARRMADNPVTEPTADRGYRKLFLKTVTQADEGVDFEFLRCPTTRGSLPRQK